ncbi:hypothetical protein QEO94_08550 [Kingella negevensis]|uniref:hypothetical protein n=1 Tax=Kingella negevensis TaxID=1522312 RepID=UPI00254376FB|nr:hypothetical protein [Kingella negevensis]WII92677.1 hypothetical protein QEO94_08550 [Kingella negevensis]
MFFALYQLSYSTIVAAEAELEPTTSSSERCNFFGICALRLIGILQTSCQIVFGQPEKFINH